MWVLNGERIRQAREIRGWTQTELSRRIDACQSAIAQYEGGTSIPTQEKIEAIAFQTGFPVSFFRQGDAVDFPLGSLLFRAKASMASVVKNRVRQYGGLFFEAVEKMESRLTKVPVRIPRLVGDPEEAARITRSELGLSPNGPVDLLVRPIEMAGGLVLALPMDIDEHDAFSLWVGRESPRPVMVVSTDGPGDRARFNIAHELGHLVLHYQVTGDLKTLDDEANRFAAEFLMPKETIEQEIIPPVTLMGLQRLGLRWKVSVQALMYRSRALGITSQRQYVYLNQQLSKLGLKKKSLVDVLVERPRAFRQMAELIYGDPIDCRQMASELNIPLPILLEAMSRYSEKNRALYAPEKAEEGGNGKLVQFVRRDGETA
jgi:Zn-dependent peptidase ImmA (M78 family)/DNA-binding XRE family transcriptional regulator